MDIVKFLFFILARELPDELILMILFQFRAIQHPVVSQLLKKTENILCELNQKNIYGIEVNKVYNNLKTQNKDKKVDIHEIMSNHFNSEIYWNNPDLNFLLRYDDFGYFIKRSFGKLNYSIKHDYKNVDTSSHFGLFDLTRSQKIIEKYTCKCDYKLKFYYNVNKRDVKIYAKRGSAINYDSVTKDLVYLEKTFNLPNFVCVYCKMDKGRYILYHTDIELTKGYRNKQCFNRSHV